MASHFSKERSSNTDDKSDYSQSKSQAKSGSNSKSNNGKSFEVPFTSDKKQGHTRQKTK